MKTRLAYPYLQHPSKPLQTVKERTMFKHILIPTDDSDLSNMAITQGVKFAKEMK